MAAKPGGWRRPGGLRSALQQAEQATILAEAALRLPALSCSKPLLLAAQLHVALQHLQRRSTQGEADEASGAAGSGREPGAAAAPADEHVATAARHLQRLVCVDFQHEANEYLLFWMLVLTAQRGLAANSQASQGTANGHLEEGSDDSSSSSSSSSDGASDTSSEPGSRDGRGPEHRLKPNSADALADGAGHEGLAVWLTWRLSPGDLLLLVEAMEWEHLLARSLEWDPTLGQRLLSYWSLGGRQLGLPTAGTLVHLQLLARTALHVSRQLEGAAWGQALPPEPQAAQLAAELELVQQHLLAWQEAAAVGLAVEQAGPFQRLAGALDAPMAALLALSQQPGWSTSHQRLFQQLCQARARLAMLLMPIPASSPGGEKGSAGAGTVQEAEAGAGGWTQQDIPGCPAGDVWQQVLQLSGPAGQHVSGVGSAAAAAAAAVQQAQDAGKGGAYQALFLAAQAAVWRMWQGDMAAGSFTSRLGTAVNASNWQQVSRRLPQPLPGFAAQVAALPGVTFPPPLMPNGTVAAPRAAAAPLQQHAAAAGRGEASPAEEAEQAAALLAQDADPLGPAGLALAALDVAQHYIGSQPCSHPASGQRSERLAAPLPANSRLTGGARAPTSAAAGTLLWLAQGAAMRVDERQQQRALLQCALQGAWLQGLREAVAEDAAVQERCRRELVALSNRLADDDSAVKVFGDERQRLATLVQEILPYALLVPGAVVERLVTDALCHDGQADAIVEALAELPPLAHFSQPASQGPSYLTQCLCSTLSGPAKPSSSTLGSAVMGPTPPAFQLPSLLDSPPASRAFLALATRLCCARSAGGRGGSSLLVDPRVLLSRAVLPALRPAAGDRPHPALCLALDLACSLLGCGSSQGAALSQSQALPPQPAGSSSSSSSMPSGAEAHMHAAWVLLQWPAGEVGGCGQLGSAGSASSAGSAQVVVGSSGQGSLAAQLLLPLLSLLDFSRRQLSCSPAVLLTPLDAYSLASRLAQRILRVLQAAVLGRLGRRPGELDLAPAAMQAATAVAAAAAGHDGQLPDAWLRLRPLLTVLGVQGRQLAAQLQPPSPSCLDGAEAACRLLQLCTAHAPIASWAAQQAVRGCLASVSAGPPAAAAAPAAATIPLGQPAASALGQGDLVPEGHALQLLPAIRQLPLQQARRALVSACALTLPVCTPAEAARVLEAGLPLLVAAVAGQQWQQQQQQQQQQQGALQAAVLEVACRAVHALALQPGSFPIAGVPAAAGAAVGEVSQEALGTGAEQAVGPSPVRRVAVERALRHLSAHCQAITTHVQAAPTAAAAAAGAATAAAGAGEAGLAGPAGLAAAAAAAVLAEAPIALQLAPSAAAGLAVRAFVEVCRLAAALQPFYPCATLQVCLLHLIQVIRACDLGALHGPHAEVLQHSAAKLGGQLGETVRFALEEAEP